MLRIYAPVVQSFRMAFSVQVDIPALDRLVNFLESRQQQQIDELVSKLKAANAATAAVVASERIAQGE